MPEENLTSRAFRTRSTEANPFYPRLLGRRGAIACEHHLAAHAGAEILGNGGNAVDAAVAAILVEGLVDPQMHTIGGECPFLIYLKSTGRVIAINGNTAAPERATPEALRERGLGEVPAEGILAAGVPAAPASLVTALLHFGTLPFSEVSLPARELARTGFPVPRGLVAQEKFGVRDLEQQFRIAWPGSAALYLPNGLVLEEGAIFKNAALADMLDYLCSLEKRTGERTAGLKAVLDGFYRGEVCSEIELHVRQRDGLLQRSDLERYETYLEEPAAVEFHDVKIFKCGAWNQGPALLQALQILKHFDLATMGHNSVDYVHHVVEAIKLAYADREQYYGDPRHVDVPLEQLLAATYGRMRAGLIERDRASRELQPGDPKQNAALLDPSLRLGGRSWGPGTVHVDVIDRDSNMVSATPSGAWIKSSEVMSGLGFPLGNRLMTFYLEPAHHPNLLKPFKRPRTTISPSLAFKAGQPWMVFGSMGGDQQDQWQLQFLLNRAVFGMTIAEAIEAAKFSSEHFPGFFAPHDFALGRLRVEPRIGVAVCDELAKRGHDVQLGADWSEGHLLAAARDPVTGVLEAGCDPRGAKGEIFSPAALCW